ncbi:MAG: TlpA disulfide reductase family protein [Bacteroidota bacterium]
MRHTLHFTILAALLFLFGCQDEPTSPGIQPMLVPNTDQGLSFPVYDSFDDIAPLFEQQNDTVYVINFWSTWCKPCVEEMPYFVQLAEDYQGQPLRIVLVSLDFKKDITTKLPKFIEKLPLDLPVVALTDKNQSDWIERVDRRWSGTIPVTVIYRNGQRTFIDTPFKTYQDLKGQVESLEG